MNLEDFKEISDRVSSQVEEYRTEMLEMIKTYIKENNVENINFYDLKFILDNKDKFKIDKTNAIHVLIKIKLDKKTDILYFDFYDTFTMYTTVMAKMLTTRQLCKVMKFIYNYLKIHGNPRKE